MAMSNKKANYCDHIDRISDLPSYIIDDILERLNIRDLVRTSILSRKWRYIWISVPRLEFDEDFLKSYRHFDDPGSEISKIVTQVLSLHNGPVYTFILSIPFDVTITSEDLGTWILFLSRRGIKYLELVDDSFDPGTMPFDVFSCQELTYLKLDGFYMPDLPNLCGFKRLLVLHLEQVTFWSDGLQNLISGCPLLEELSISHCYGFECIDLSTPMVKVLRIQVDGDIESISLKNVINLIDLTIIADRENISGLIKSLPKIKMLSMESDRKKIMFADMVTPSMLINSFSSIKYLKLTSVDLNRELLYIVSMIKSASSLVHLVIESYIDVDYTTQVSEDLEELECISCCLSQLQRVDIMVKASCQHAMSLIRFILTNSPLLEFLTFYVYSLSSDLSDAPMLLSISQDLLLMERASQQAEVELLYE